NVGTDAKIIADDIQFITDQELRNYESTGKKMSKPVISNKVQTKRIVSEPLVSKPLVVQAKIPKKLYVHISDPDDHESLLSLKKVCSDYTGDSDIVLVLGLEKKSAIKLPFKVDLSKELVAEMAKILGDDKVVVK
ncbi:MAG TPA: hypothetical protein VMR16_01525, partial [Candidatus Saccharimonadales bacterium]|nr:hypothetical protein [Candidatus Saccharimonadales bacterium]